MCGDVIYIYFFFIIYVLRRQTHTELYSQYTIMGARQRVAERFRKNGRESKKESERERWREINRLVR